MPPGENPESASPVGCSLIPKGRSQRKYSRGLWSDLGSVLAGKQRDFGILLDPFRGGLGGRVRLRMGAAKGREPGEREDSETGSCGALYSWSAPQSGCRLDLGSLGLKHSVLA